MQRVSKTNSLKNEQSISIETIDPDYAKYLLSLNVGNFRKPEKNRIAQYALQMQKGEWELNGETIKITDNVLIDGQHRLLAIIESGKTIKSAVAWNVATSAVNIDRGKPRTIAQWLHHIGVPNAIKIASVSKLCVMHDKGQWKTQTMPLRLFTDADIVSYAEKYHEHLQEALKLTNKNKNLITASVGATIIHIGSGRSIDPERNELVKWFWNGVATGADLEEEDIPLLLRNRMIAAKVNPSRSLTRSYERWLVTKAWNSFVEDRPMKTMRIRLSGPGKEFVPESILDLTSYEK